MAGGQSRRFGSDKAHAEIAGHRLIDLVVEALKKQTDTLVICGREMEGYVSLADQPNSNIGPLGGLLSALQYANECGHHAVLSAGCDVPDLPSDLSEQLHGAGAAIVENQPVIGLWPRTSVEPLSAFINDGGRSLYRFADHIDARRVQLAKPIANINSPDDLTNYKLARS